MLYRDNFHCVHVGGFPEGCGDLLSVEYDSGKKIYKSSNQSHMLSEEEASLIFEAFHNDAKRMGFEYTTAGSNMLI